MSHQSCLEKASCTQDLAGRSLVPQSCLDSRPCVARGGFYYSLGRLRDSIGFGLGRPAGQTFKRTKCARMCGTSRECARLPAKIRSSSWRRPFELRKAPPYVSKRAASFEYSVIGTIWTADRVLLQLELRHAWASAVHTRVA